MATDPCYVSSIVTPHYTPTLFEYQVGDSLMGISERLWADEYLWIIGPTFRALPETAKRDVLGILRNCERAWLSE